MDAAWIETRVTYLEMFEPPRSPEPRDPGSAVVLHAPAIPLAFYRYLYDVVGRPWHWFDRTWLDDRALADDVHADGVEVHVLYVAGAPAGFCELDFRGAPGVELAYFGIVPERHGQGYGPWLLARAVRLAFRPGTRRFWLHTCELDHPKALAVYRRAGFVPYDVRVERYRAAPATREAERRGRS